MGTIKGYISLIPANEYKNKHKINIEEIYRDTLDYHVDNLNETYLTELSLSIGNMLYNDYANKFLLAYKLKLKKQYPSIKLSNFLPSKVKLDSSSVPSYYIHKIIRLIIADIILDNEKIEKKPLILKYLSLNDISFKDIKECPQLGVFELYMYECVTEVLSIMENMPRVTVDSVNELVNVMVHSMLTSNQLERQIELTLTELSKFGNINILNIEFEEISWIKKPKINKSAVNNHVNSYESGKTYQYIAMLWINIYRHIYNKRNVEDGTWTSLMNFEYISAPVIYYITMILEFMFTEVPNHLDASINNILLKMSYSLINSVTYRTSGTIIPDEHYDGICNISAAIDHISINRPDLAIIDIIDSLEMYKSGNTHNTLGEYLWYLI